MTSFNRRWIRPPLLGVAVMVALDLGQATPALAQIRVATLDELRRELAPGDSISLVRTTGDAVRGRLLWFGDNELDIRVETPGLPGKPGQKRGLDVKIPLGAIQSLERPRDSSRNGALIGAGIGAGVSLAQFIHAAATDYNEIDEWGASYLGIGGILTGIGWLIGRAIDSAHSKPGVTFEASSTASVRIRTVPLRSRSPGIALAVSF